MRDYETESACVLEGERDTHRACARDRVCVRDGVCVRVPPGRARPPEKKVSFRQKKDAHAYLLGSESTLEGELRGREARGARSCMGM